jgi:hypothetical protein
MTDKIWKFFTSLRLTVVLLALGLLLVFLGTIAQVHEGLWNAQMRWFKEPLVVRHAGDPWWVPPIFPGGYLIGIMLLLNLVAAHIKRFDLKWSKFGINLTHFGIIILLVGQLFTDQFSQESVMNLREGETKQFSEAARNYELVFTRPLNDKQEEVVAIPAELLKKGETITNEKLPFAVKVKEFWANSDLDFRAPMKQNGPPLTNKGIAKDWDFERKDEAKGMDQNNFPAAIVELVANEKAADLGTWVVPSWASNAEVADNIRRSYAKNVGADIAQSITDKLTAPQEVEAGGNAWRMALRPVRFYKNFSLTLLKTTHDLYPGSDIPKNFQSRVRIDNPVNGEKREVDIYMNNPLRYQGLTFYQSTMSAEVGRSGLQVVHNPSWQTPYLGCLVVALGMVSQFGFHLVRFITKRRSAAAHA